MDIVAPAVAGFFAITTAFLGWRLKRVSDEKDRKASLRKERMDELKNLYSDIIENFDGAFKQVASEKEFTLSERFSKAGARLHLLAPHLIVERYDEACSLLDSWSLLLNKATPPRREINGVIITTLQAPDPTKKYKELAEDELLKLQEHLQLLKVAMRSHLATIGEFEPETMKDSGT